ncbi:MAG TPA: ribonuclease P protein component [Candidatus Acidoferrales bacterium]|nr:ribonuclease P protein component [Candidatus Acidoferrales bacterium]
MLSREYRLPATTKLSQARFARFPSFSVKYAVNGLTVSRFAFIVRKSVDSRAVARNRIRRVFRSCIEELREQIFPGYDMLFFLEKGIIDKQQQDLCQELRTVLQQKELIK